MVVHNGELDIKFTAITIAAAAIIVSVSLGAKEAFAQAAPAESQTAPSWPGSSRPSMHTAPIGDHGLSSRPG